MNIGYRSRSKIGLTRAQIVRFLKSLIGAESPSSIKAEFSALKEYAKEKNKKIERLRNYIDKNRLKIETLRNYIDKNRLKIETLKERARERHSKIVEIQTLYRSARSYFPMYFQGFLAEAVTNSAEILKSDCYIALLPNSLPAAYELKRLNGGGAVFCDNVENVEAHKHSAAPRWSPIALGIVNHAAYGAMMEADGLITVGDALAKTLNRFGPPVHVLKNFREFAIAERNDELREMCGISSDEVILFASGNVVIGFEPVLRALALIPAKFHLVGFVRLKPEAYCQAMEDLIIELGLENRVHLFDFVNYMRLAHLAAGADIGLITSDVANPNGAVALPNRCFDYIAAGLPVIAPPMPDVKALIAEHGFGKIVEDVTAESWADNIQAVAENLEGFRAQSNLARSVLTWESQEDALYKFLGEPKSVTLVSFRDLTRYQRYKRLSRTLLKRGCKVTTAFVSMSPDLDHLVDGVDYYVTDERHYVEKGLRKLQKGSESDGRSQGTSATPDVRCCHVYPIQTFEYRGTRHHYGDAISTTDAAGYCRFARPSPQHH